MSKAKNLVKIGNDISSELGVPIVNKRISITPVSLISAASKGHLEIIRTLDKIADETGVDFLGGYSALVHKAMTPYEKNFYSQSPKLCRRQIRYVLPST